MSTKKFIGENIHIQDQKNLYNNRIGLVTNEFGSDLEITLVSEGRECVTLVSKKNVRVINPITDPIVDQQDDDFTDGPWCVRPAGYSSTSFGDHTGFNITTAKWPVRTICNITLNNAVGVPERIRRANAHLVAAAPELLEALKICINNPNDISDWACAWSIAKNFPVTPDVLEKADKYNILITAIKNATQTK